MPEAAEILTEALGRPIAFADTDRTGPAVQQGDGVDARVVRERRLQRRHRWPGTRVRPPTHEAPRLGTAPRAARWALKRENPRRDCMKAIRLLEFGGQLVFDDVPTPAIARDEVLVKVKSTTVNHVDLVKTSGAVRQIFPINLPWIPGHEISGVIKKIGVDYSAFMLGCAS